MGDGLFQDFRTTSDGNDILGNTVPSTSTVDVSCNFSNLVSPGECLEKINNLRVVYTNSRSLCSKRVEFEPIILEEKANLVAVTETWFNADKELKLTGYDGYFSSRTRRGGGVAIYLDSCLLSGSQLVKSTSDLGFDMVIIEMHFCDKRLYVCVVYRPPDLSLNDTYSMCEILRSLSGKDVLIMGDFNLPGINWINFVISPNCIKSQESEVLLEFVNEFMAYLNNIITDNDIEFQRLLENKETTREANSCTKAKRAKRNECKENSKCEILNQHTCLPLLTFGTKFLPQF